ncbi:MAG: HEAT repeat domain-containing protein [Myxococcota bacterium]
MLAAEITLDAALRDLDSEREHYRHQAVRNLAPALLEELDVPGPHWRSTTEHARGEAVLRALLERLSDEHPAPLRGLAATGLGMLGEPEALDHVEPWLALTGDDEDQAYLRECAVVTASFLGKAAADADAAPELRTRIDGALTGALKSDNPELRFQAGLALVELQGDAAEPALVDALRNEEDERVQEGLVDALAHLDPPGAEACDVLETLVQGENAWGSLGFLCAMTLAAARRATARPRLLDGLDLRHERDDALEGLAALGRAEPAEVERVQRLAKRMLLPGVTRVRAAYALARMAGTDGGPNPGLTLLERLRWHPRAAVREAVGDAFENLETLAARERNAD